MPAVTRPYRARLLPRAIGASTVVVLALLVGIGTAGADGATTIACSTDALANAFQHGGSYVYGADCSVSVTAQMDLAAGTALSIDAAGHRVSFGGGGLSKPHRLASVEGTLTLSGITVGAFASGGTPANGSDGTVGAAGGTGGAGGDGGNGTDGADARGGALLIGETGDVTLVGDTFNANSVQAGNGGKGGNGGNGGAGAGGSTGASATTVGAVGAGGGPGGDGGDGGDGGAAGSGGIGRGGAIANAGTLKIRSSTFASNTVGGGFGGFPGDGGAGGAGGAGGQGGQGDYGNGGNGGEAGDGGHGGQGGAVGTPGSGYGGAIFNSGTLDVTGTTWQSNQASSGAAQPGSGGGGGNGGHGGHAGGTGAIKSGCGECVPPPGANPDAQDGVPGHGGNGGDGGDGHAEGPTAPAVGGAVYSTEAWTQGDATVNTNYLNARGANNSQGGRGGKSGLGDNTGNDGVAGANGRPQDSTYVEGTAIAPNFFPDPGDSVPHDLSVGVSATDPDGKPLTGDTTAVGQTIKVRVTVAEAAGAGAPIAGVKASVPPSADPGDVVTLTGGPTPAQPSGGTTLQPGTSASYDLTYKITGTGKVTLATTATGSEGGIDQSAKASVDLLLGQPLKVTVSWQQNGHAIKVGDVADAVKLADNDAGEVPQDVDAIIHITNVSAKTQEHVSVADDPALSYHDPADARQQPPILVTGGPDPETIDPLAPGASRDVLFQVTVQQNGVFDFSPLVLSSSQGEDATNKSTGVGTLTALPTALLWLKVQKPAGAPVSPGTPVPLLGTITNRSNTKTLDVAPLEPSDTGQAGGGALHDIQSGPLADGVQLPFAGKLDPGQALTLSGVVQTPRIHGTRAEVAFAPAGSIIVDDTHETALSAEQIGQASGSSPVHISLDQTDPPVPPVSAQSLWDSITDAGMLGTTEWMYNRTVAAADLLAHPVAGAEGVTKSIAGFAYGTSRDVGDAASLVSAMYTASVAADSMTPQQREAFRQQIVSDFQASHLGADYKQLSDAADTVLPTFQNALQTGDYNKVVAMGTSGATFGLTSVADAMLSDIAFQKMALGLKTGVAKATGVGELADAIKLSDALREHQVAQVLGKGIDGIAAGANLLAEGGKALIDEFGLTTKQITELRNYCERNKIIVALRQRGKKAAELIKKGLAVGKNEAIKLKAVNEVDIDYLGYNAEHANTVVWAEPISEAKVAQRVAGLDPEMRAVVQQRYARRVEEWHDPKIRKVIEHGEQTGEIDWGFNGTDNGAPAANRAAKRHFKLEKVNNPKGFEGRTYKQVRVGNKEGLAKGVKLVPVTQDVDVMAILGSDGRILSPAERTAAYLHLQDILDIQHGETPTWIAKGEIMFKAKAKQLVDVLKGGEPLAVFNPAGGATAGYFDPNLTIFDNATKGGRIFFDGGYNDPFAHWKLSLQLKLRDIGLFSYKTIPGGGLTLFMDLEAGSVTTTATQGGGQAQTSAAKSRKGVVVAKATKRVTHRGRVKLVLEPNQQGRRLLRRKHHLKVTVKTTFTPKGGGAKQTVTRSLVLKRRR